MTILYSPGSTAKWAARFVVARLRASTKHTTAPHLSFFIIHLRPNQTHRPLSLCLNLAQQAEQELHEAAGPTGSGVFLVRESERVPGSFALSWCQSGRISHTQILYRHNKFMFNVPTGAPKPESTLTALIESPAVCSPDCPPPPRLPPSAHISMCVCVSVCVRVSLSISL